MLFSKGSSYMVHPVKLLYIPSASDAAAPVQALFVVPKKSFRRAHDRNKLRRRMKEAYRLSKNTFYAALDDRRYQLAFIYTAKKYEDYKTISAAIEAQLEKLAARTNP